jgi:molecular chaperone GrpE
VTAAPRLAEPPTPEPRPTPPPTPEREPPQHDLGVARQELERQRLALIEACIEVAEQVDSLMLRERLEDALADVGVEPYEPDGERFDPALHDAVGRRPTSDPTLDGLVADTQRPGYRDGSTGLQLPQVLVWRHDAALGGE